MKGSTVLWIVGGVIVVRSLMRNVYVDAVDEALDNLNGRKIGAPSPARIMRPRIVRTIRDATNGDIVQLCTYAVHDPSAVVHWPDGYDPNDAPLLAWETLRSLRYVADGDDQIVQAPRVLLLRGVGDCKSFAVFAAKLMRAAGWRSWLRFVKNEPGDLFGHVYAMGERDGIQVAVDGVLDQFDVEPLHFGSIDVNLP